MSQVGHRRHQQTECMTEQPTTPPQGPQNPYFSHPAPQGPRPEGPPAPPYGVAPETATLPVQRRPRRVGLAAAVVATALVVGGAAGVGGAAAWNAYDDGDSGANADAGGVQGLTQDTIASPRDIRLGDGVVAIGSPSGLDSPVTSRIVSGLNRADDDGS